MVYTDIHMPLPGFIALDWTLMTVALIPIILRLSLRFKTHGTVHHSIATNLSDAFIVFAWIAGLVLIAINTWKNTLREKYSSWPKAELYYGVPHDLASHLLLVSTVSLYFIYVSLWCSKAAFLAFYYSLFSEQGKKTRIVLYAASAFTAATFLLHMFLLTFWCHPITRNWNVDGELCSAVHSINSVTISTFTNVATDLVILSIPISTLATLRLGRRELYGLAFVFLMGSVSIIAALARFVTLMLVRKVPKASITHTIDVWALVEIVSSLLAVCLPSLRTFIRAHKRPSPSRNSSNSNNSTSKLRQSPSPPSPPPMKHLPYYPEEQHEHSRQPSADSATKPLSPTYFTIPAYLHKPSPSPSPSLPPSSELMNRCQTPPSSLRSPTPAHLTSWLRTSSQNTMRTLHSNNSSSTAAVEFLQRECDSAVSPSEAWFEERYLGRGWNKMDEVVKVPGQRLEGDELEKKKKQEESVVTEDV